MKWGCVIIVLVLCFPVAVVADFDWTMYNINPFEDTLDTWDCVYNSTDNLYAMVNYDGVLYFFTWDPVSDTTSTPEEVVSSGLGWSSTVRVGIDGDDVFYVIYKTIDEHLIFIMRDEGGEWSSPVEVRSSYFWGYWDYDVYDIAVSQDGDDVWVICSYLVDMIDWDYRDSLFHLDPGKTSFTEHIIKQTGYYDTGYALSSIDVDDNTGDVYFISALDISGDVVTLNVGKCTPGGTISNIQNFTAYGGEYIYPQTGGICFDDEGDLHVLWDDNDAIYNSWPHYAIFQDAAPPASETELDEGGIYDFMGVGVSGGGDVYIPVLKYSIDGDTAGLWFKGSSDPSFTYEEIDASYEYYYTSKVIFDSFNRATLKVSEQDWFNSIILFRDESVPPTPTPTPSTTSPSTYGGSPDVPFPQPTYSGVEIISCTPHADNRVTLVGKVGNSTTDPIGWFILGTGPDTYAYHTVMLETDEAGFFIEDVNGMPLAPGGTYYVRAATGSGRSPFEISFTMEALPTVLPTTFGHYWQMIDRSNKSLPIFMGVIPRPFVDYFGEDSTLGWQVFYLMIFGVGFLVMFGRQRNVIIPMLVFMIAGYFIIQLIPSEMQSLAYGLCIVCAMGVIFYIVRKGD